MSIVRFYWFGSLSLEAFMFALPIFMVRGSDASAAGGGFSELSDGPRSAGCESASSDDASAGHRNRKPIVLPSQVSGGHLQAELNGLK